MAGRGVRRSEEMVMGRAKRVLLEVKSAKAVWRSSEAGGLFQFVRDPSLYHLYAYLL